MSAFVRPAVKIEKLIADDRLAARIEWKRAVAKFGPKSYEANVAHLRYIELVKRAA